MSKIIGLQWDSKTGKGRIRKQIRGETLSRRFTASSLEGAEAEYYRLIAEPKHAAEDIPTWRAAATYYLKSENKKSLERDSYALAQLDPHIGHLTLDQVHQGTLEGYILKRRLDGVRSGTVTRELAVVRRILTLAARLWRTADHKPWLPGHIPLLKMPDWHDEKDSYPLSWEEQARLLTALPQHLAPMALFGLNTGARDTVISSLRWSWEQTIAELGRKVFIVPGEYTKNGTTCLIPINRRAESVLDSVRGQDPVHVFTFLNNRGQRAPVDRMHNSGWKAAWKKAGLPTAASVNKGPHNLRHTFARRLRSAMVAHETIKALLHHIDGDITLNYAPAELEDLFRAVDAILQQKTLLRVVGK